MLAEKGPSKKQYLSQEKNNQIKKKIFKLRKKIFKSKNI